MGISKIEFTGERCIIGMASKPDEDDHIERYKFACEFVKDKNVLDAACGVGYGSSLLANASARMVTGIDISSEAIEYAKNNYENRNLIFEQHDLLLMKRKEKYNIIVSFETIEHIIRPRELLKIFHEALADDGLLIISTPNRTTYSQGKRFNDKPNNKYHMQEYTLAEFKNLLKTSGFKILKTYGQRLRFRLPFYAINRKYLKIFKPDLNSNPKCLKFKIRIPRYIVTIACKAPAI